MLLRNPQNLLATWSNQSSNVFPTFFQVSALGHFDEFVKEPTLAAFLADFLAKVRSRYFCSDEDEQSWDDQDWEWEEFEEDSDEDGDVDFGKDESRLFAYINSYRVIPPSFYDICQEDQLQL